MLLAFASSWGLVKMEMVGDNTDHKQIKSNAL